MKVVIFFVNIPAVRTKLLTLKKVGLGYIKTADWIIDMGPDGGVNGGQIIAEGNPEKISEISSSYTGNFLKNIINTKFKKTA